MTLIEYCITIGLLSCIMVVGLNMNNSLYQSLYLSSHYSSTVRMLEVTRNQAFISEESLTISKTDLDENAPLLIISGPSSIEFTSSGNISQEISYSVNSGTFHSNINIDHHGFITY